MTQTLLEQIQHSVLQVLVKVDQYISAYNHIHFTKNTICDKVMVGEGDPLFEFVTHACLVVPGMVVVRERSLGR